MRSAAVVKIEWAEEDNGGARKEQLFGLVR
jgi:hypothetical protein